jgi:hypothetical protein
MAEIGMGEAAKRLNMSTQMSARRALTRAGITLRPISTRAYVVDEADLERYIAEHGTSTGRGRPSKERKISPEQRPERRYLQQKLEAVIREWNQAVSAPEGTAAVSKQDHLALINGAGRRALEEYLTAWGDEADQELLSKVPPAFGLSA